VNKKFCVSCQKYFLIRNPYKVKWPTCSSGNSSFATLPLQRKTWL
jgi:hypothetical protein